MRYPGFIGPGYLLPSLNVACQRCVNLYPEKYEGVSGKDGEVAYLTSPPGLITRVSLPDIGPVRATYRASNGDCFVVSGSTFYRIGADWVHTAFGTLTTTEGPVSISDNGSQVIVVDGVAGWVFTLATGAWAQITAEGFPAGCKQVVYLDGSFLAAKPGTQEVYYSDLLDGTSWPLLNFFSAESTADEVVAIAINHQQIWVMGAQSTEVFYDAGAADAPFQRVQGAVIAHGCRSPFSVCILDNILLWLGDGDNGDGIVWAMNGYTPQRVSNHAVEYALRGKDLSQAYAWTYQEAGHHFYCLQVPGLDSTWVFDAIAQAWHERTWMDDNGGEHQHRGSCHAFAHGRHIVGDRETGTIYEQTLDVVTDAGRPRRWRRTAPLLSSDMRRVFFPSFQLDAEVGVGLDGLQQGAEPMVELSWSDDSGHTWKPARERSMGRIGEYRHRVIWRQLGQSRFRVFSVSGTDPVKITLLGAAVDAKPGGAV